MSEGGADKEREKKVCVSVPMLACCTSKHMCVKLDDELMSNVFHHFQKQHFPLTSSFCPHSDLRAIPSSITPEVIYLLFHFPQSLTRLTTLSLLDFSKSNRPCWPAVRDRPGFK